MTTKFDLKDEAVLSAIHFADHRLDAFQYLGRQTNVVDGLHVGPEERNSLGANLFL